ncbi:MAG TPA: DUF3551 domain-containing protein [Xanthobacteraceae bacterium]|nr:DUF3551 domain-containing protein [Xanthobacteraceae bacterium]
MTSMQRCSRIRARFWLAALVALVGTIALADAASAQPVNGRGRWCMTFNMYGGTLDCAYNSLEQCMASAAGVSNQCSLNPWYAGPPEAAAPRRRDQRR